MLAETVGRRWAFLAPLPLSVLAETVGWRWAFLAPLPLIVLAAAMVMPSLRGVSVGEGGSKLPVAASLVLMLRAGAARRTRGCVWGRGGGGRSVTAGGTSAPAARGA